MSYIKTLKNKTILRLTSIQFLSYFGTWFSQVAISSMMLEYGASDTQISYIFTALMLPSIILAPFVGYLIDRFEFKRLVLTLLIVEVITTFLFMTIDSIEDLNLLILYLFIRSIAQSIIFSAEMALFPKILKGEMLKNTNEIHSIVWSACFALGMAFGGLSTNYLGYKATFLIDITLYIIAITILFNLQIEIKGVRLNKSISQMVKSGLDYIFKNRKVLYLMFLHATLGITSFDIIVTLLADFYYKYIISIPLAIGFVSASRALGLIISPFIFGKYINRKNLYLFFISQGFAIALWAYFESSFYITLLTIFIVGLFTTTLWSYTYYILQQEIEREFLGRVIAYNDMIFMSVSITTTLLIGYLSSKIPIEYITSSIGLVFILIGITIKKLPL